MSVHADDLLLDTSLLLALEEGFSFPARSVAVSVITLGELHAGVLLARDEAVSDQRRRRLRDIRAAFIGLSVDEDVAERYGEVLSVSRRDRCITTATDLLIVATARAHHLTLRTLDRRQARLAEAVGVAVSGG